MHLAPGAGAQPLHRDGAIYPLAHPHPPTIMPTMWALSDFHAGNGATRVVPGSHRWEQERTPYEDEIIAADMPAGSVLIYTCGVLHGGGDNRSDDVRTGLALQYALGWLRQEENQYLVNRPGIAREYPERLQRLIGYDYGGPYLGFAHCDDPHRVLEDSREGPPTTLEPGGGPCGAENRVAALRRGGVRGDANALGSPRLFCVDRSRRLRRPHTLPGRGGGDDESIGRRVKTSIRAWGSLRSLVAEGPMW